MRHVLTEKICKPLTEKQFETFLIRIGGLLNGYYPEKPPIISKGFFSVGNGWLRLLRDLISELVEAGWNRQICQVKEKFGCLRFYTNELPEGGRKIINTYESLSCKVCETCGQPGKERGGGWISTLCNKHYAEKTERLNR